MLAARDRQAEAAQVGLVLRLRCAVEQQARGVAVMAQRVAELAVVNPGNKGVVQHGKQRYLHGFTGSILQREDEMEAGRGRLAGLARHERREGIGRNADRERRIVVAKRGHRIPGVVIDGLDVLHVAERIEVVFVAAEIQPAELGRPAAGFARPQQKAEVRRRGCRAVCRRAESVRRPGTLVEDLPLVKATVGANFEKAGPDAAQRRARTHRDRRRDGDRAAGLGAPLRRRSAGTTRGLGAGWILSCRGRRGGADAHASVAPTAPAGRPKERARLMALRHSAEGAAGAAWYSGGVEAWSSADTAGAFESIVDHWSRSWR